MIQTVVFFARNYQAKLFPLLKSEKYRSIFVVLNKKEKQIVLDNGGVEVICFEEEFDTLPLASYEGTYLEYSFGCDRNYVGLNLYERDLILKKTITFWRDIITKFSPKLIVNETVAIEPSEILALEAKRHGIKYISWMSFPKKNTFYWQITPFHNSLGETLAPIEPSIEEIEESRLFIKGLRDGLEKPFYVSRKSTRYSVIKPLKSIWGILKEKIQSSRMNKLKHRVSYGYHIDMYKKNVKRFLLSVFYSSKRYDQLKDYSDKELIFYPLHYEPEAVLFYMAYFFDNQVSVIENVLKCIGDNQILVVKEHPQQPGVLLESRFRNVRKRYPNLIFVSGEEESSQVLGKCSTIVSLGSTAGFEALALGKRVINLGRVFYGGFQGVNNCKSFHEVYDLIRGKTPYKDPVDFDVFVAKMTKYVRKGNPFPHAELYSDSNILNITKAIEDELAK